MPMQILMPALSPTMEEGTLAKWLVKEGDAVKSGDVMAEIETDKATMEFEAVDEGVIGKILIAEGSEGVKVNTPIAVLLGEGEDASAAAAPTPAMPGTFSVPARRPRSCPPPRTTGDNATPSRMYSAPTPLGPPNLCAATVSRSTPSRSTVNGILPTVCAASV